MHSEQTVERRWCYMVRILEDSRWNEDGAERGCGDWKWVLFSDYDAQSKAESFLQMDELGRCREIGRDCDVLQVQA